jgi:excisionase family DNA binding protein
MTTAEAAHFLNVSRPFVIKEMEAGKLRHRRVGTHRRVDYDELVAYRSSMQRTQDDALQALADEAQDLGLDG